MSKNDKQLTLENRIERLVVLSDLGKTFTSTIDFEDLLKTILKKISEILEPQSWQLLLKHPSQDALEYKILINDPSVNRSQLVYFGEGCSGWVAKTKTPILWSQNIKIPESSQIPPQIQKEFQNASYLCVPLQNRNTVLGVIFLKHADPDFFTQDDLITVTTISDFAAIAIENAINYERIEELTIRDDLTTLYNQRYLHQILDQEVERASRYFKEFSMVFIDLDKFKNVNDTYGHIYGSELLQETANVLLQNTREVDHCARYGGDEFVIVLPETGKKEAIYSAERIRQAIESHVFLERKGINAKFTASFGVATFPTDAQSKNDLIKMADEAMYEAKHKNRNAVQGYEKGNDA
ncbi:MAG: sensor domain-containing diguanylate cyclase [Bdellovibrionales bacterium]|nr:sensor domain-containing diguanylate cyclase [Bdellovibrionales bacterium]